MKEREKRERERVRERERETHEGKCTLRNGKRKRKSSVRRSLSPLSARSIFFSFSLAPSSVCGQAIEAITWMGGGHKPGPSFYWDGRKKIEGKRSEEGSRQ